ncbi:MAG: DUF6089 family protein [Crocinitomicaceae bacterium]
MTRITFLLILASLTFSFDGYSQRYSRSELGVMVGTSYYIGDLNQFRHFRDAKLAGGLFYRYNVNSRVAIRGNLNYLRVEADDADANLELLRERNLNFKSTIWELGSGVELNYFPFQIGHDRFRGTGYLFAGLSAFRMNPKTEYNGDDVALQELGTEGQGSSLTQKSKYGLIQIAVPFGFGGRVSLGEFASLGVEFGVRKTFTDYLDDVGTGTYVDPDALAAENGPLAAELSNRSGNRFGRRGNDTNKDWFFFTGATLTFKIGKKPTCPGNPR